MKNRRLWSLAALLLLAASLVIAIIVGVSRFPRGLTVLACLLVAAIAGFWALRRRGFARGAGLAVAAAALAGAIVFVVSEGSVLANVAVIICFIGALEAARQAFRVHVTLPKAPAPQRAVMFFNARSGGGKATKFHLADEAERRGVRAVELVPGTDLEELVRAAVAEGADALAMAGGDGSQAIVAKVAAEVGLPYACIPAGTRNHFALDLGVDRDDVVGALDALVDGGERTVDLAEVNGRVFVNNVSLGLYADAVQKESYRDAKLRTLLDTVPDALGPDATPVPLLWRRDGAAETGLAVLVSNNEYRLTRAIASGTRPRMDQGVLGVAVIGAGSSSPGTDVAPSPGASRSALSQFSVPTFEVACDQPVPAGIDGEATVLEAPLRFVSRPGVLRVRIAPAHPGAAPSALVPDGSWATVLMLASFVLGHDRSPS